MSENRFTGKTIIVTGAGSGIGRATATRLAAEGATVIATDIVETGLTELVTAATGTVVTVVGDVSEAETIASLIEAAAGKLDGVANVAGIMDRFLPAGEIDDATWDRVMRVNVTGPVRLIRAALPLLIASGNGSIVNVASEAALRGSAAGVAYTASKHAIAGVTKNTAFMYGPQGVRTNAVAPGPVATNIEGTPGSELGAARIFPILGALALPVAEADRLAAAITWLLSDDSLNINGVILPSDGGWSAI
ncbi:SDR family NAD(P)-dependent oxidoreductase [Plantibacter sp. YIM 135249]|uniref:SDR family NAD(P)-dependent oxidoreductase n=1 Tax=Plantibacter sp. YIM 135249 TaxID=3423918 RepID=UPI003D32E715